MPNPEPTHTDDTRPDIELRPAKSRPTKAGLVTAPSMCEVETDHLERFAHSLIPGDILVFKTASVIGHVIRAFDASGFNHAAIVLEPGTIVHTKWPEGTESCIEQLPFLTAVESMGVSSIAVRRADGRGDEIVARAREFLADAPPYGYNALFLSAVITDLTSRVTEQADIPLLSQIEWEMVLAAYFGLLGDGFVTCAEFAFRCLPPDLQGTFPRTGRSRPESTSVQELPEYRAEIEASLEHKLNSFDAEPIDFRWVLDELIGLIRMDLVEDDADLCSPHIGGVLMAAAYWVTRRLIGDRPLDLPTLQALLAEVEGDKWVEAHAETLTPGDLHRAVPPLLPVAMWNRAEGSATQVAQR